MQRYIVSVDRELRRAESWLLGPLDEAVRHNFRVDLFAAILFGPFVACLNFIPVVLRRMGASTDWIAFYFTQAFIGFILTFLSVRIFPKGKGMFKSALVFYFISRSSFLWMAWLGKPETLILALMGFWLFETFPLPVYTKIMQLVYPANLRGQAMSLVRVGMSLASLVATPIAGWLLDQFGYTALFLIGGIFAIVSSFVFSRLRIDEKEPSGVPLQVSGGVLDILRVDSRFRVYLGSLVLFGIGFLVISPLMPLVQVDRLKLSYASVGWLGFIQSAFFLAGYLSWGKLIDKQGGIWALRWAFGTAVIIPLSYLFARSGWVLAPGFAAMGIVNSAMDVVLLNTVIQLAPEKQLGEYSALQTVVLGVRGLVAPLIGVSLLNIGLPQWVLFLGAAFLILCGVYVLHVANLSDAKLIEQRS